MRRIGGLAIAVAVMACLWPANDAAAASQLGSDFIAPCHAAAAQSQSTETLYAQGVCLGIVETVADYEDMAHRACFPHGVTVGQEVRIVTDYLDAHPEKLKVHFAGLAASALQEAFPCKPQRTL